MTADVDRLPLTVDIGQAALALRGAHVAGHLLSVHRNALYVEVAGVVLAVVPSHVSRGPMHVRVHGFHHPFTSPAAGDVSIDSDHLLIGHLAFSLNAPVWTPAVPHAPANMAPVLESLVRHRPTLVLGDTAPDRQDLLHVVQDEGIAGLIKVIGGAGMGLTPAGDDVIAGVLLVAAWTDVMPLSVREELAMSVATHPISRAFLLWAARGQSIEPTHQLGIAASHGDASAAETALERLAAVGHTSGLDMAFGLMLGAQAGPLLRP
jgi:hypothetical protein